MVKAVDPMALQVTITKEFSALRVVSLMSSSVGCMVDRQEVMAHEVASDMGLAWLKFPSTGSGVHMLWG
jgi:peptide/nickel transport system substrate-binding protein